MQISFGDDWLQLGPYAAATIVIVSMFLGFRKRSLSYFLCCFVFGVYLLFALDLTLFPMYITRDASHLEANSLNFARSINMIPFYFGEYGNLRTSLPGLLLNILLTVPFGFGIHFMIPHRFSRADVIWVALCVGIGIETAQVVASIVIGTPYRTIDINDMMMNGLGVLIGCGLFALFARVYAAVMSRFALRQRGFTGYLYGVAEHALSAAKHPAQTG